MIYLQIFIGIILLLMIIGTGFLIGSRIEASKSIRIPKGYDYKKKHDLGVLVEAYEKDKLRVEKINSDDKMIYYRISLIEHNPGNLQLKFTDKES